MYLETSFNSLNAWTENVDTMANNLKTLVKQLRKEGTVSMARANVRQLVSTKGITVAPAQFDRLLDQAIERADLEKFIR